MALRITLENCGGTKIISDTILPYLTKLAGEHTIEIEIDDGERGPYIPLNEFLEFENLDNDGIVVLVGNDHTVLDTLLGVAEDLVINLVGFVDDSELPDEMDESGLPTLNRYAYCRDETDTRNLYQSLPTLYQYIEV